MTKNQSPKSAATVILLRPEANGGFELFMIKRPDKMEFLGGIYAFPGGSVKKEDCGEALFRLCYGLSPTQARTVFGNELSPELSLGYWVAGIRELFEEVGVLLCVREGGRPVDMDQQALKERLAEKRQSLIEGSIDFETLLESEGLYCSATSLRYLSHWLTPEEFPIRFDTRFYLGLLPPDQTPLPNSQEVAESLWITPDRALERCQQDNLPIIFPTFASLRNLANFDSWARLRTEFGLDNVS
jgi:8-oxo-dGTP pyrophosphatase MutT (NUDIX family)